MFLVTILITGKMLKSMNIFGLWYEYFLCGFPSIFTYLSGFTQIATIHGTVRKSKNIFVWIIPGVSCYSFNNRKDAQKYEQLCCSFYWIFADISGFDQTASMHTYPKNTFLWIVPDIFCYNFNNKKMPKRRNICFAVFMRLLHRVLILAKSS